MKKVFSLVALVFVLSSFSLKAFESSDLVRNIDCDDIATTVANVHDEEDWCWVWDVAYEACMEATEMMK